MGSPSYVISRELFLRVLGVIYLAAFISFGTQIIGLIGKEGILPVQNLLHAAGLKVGPERYWLLPTVCWLDASDNFLKFLPAAGAVLSFVLILGIAPTPILILLWLLYLSLVSAGQDFMEFQWDNLLLEVGFLAIFLAPLRMLPKSTEDSPAPKMPLWLFRWLLFRLMFSSGVVKLMSGDPTWRNLTALNFHYETQPLPTWIGWYFHQLPFWFQKLSVLVTFIAELIVPFFIFGPRPVRLIGCGALVLFQVLIALNGNYCFFNLLAIALCLLLIDDFVWLRGTVTGGARLGQEPALAVTVPVRWRQWIIAPIAAVIVLVSGMQLVRLFRIRVKWPIPLVALYQSVAPFRSVNSYGLFAVMTTSRPEIIIEGSNDGTKWLAYEFKWKPGDLKRRPGFVAPHQPRLDWQMWFAALSGYRENPWFMNFMTRILEGSPPALRLLKRNPFPGKPPRFLRAVVYDYHFTGFATKRSQGTWWRRDPKGLYCPILSLKRGQ